MALGEPGENGRGGYFRQATQIDGANNAVKVIDDYTLITARY